MIFPYRHAHWWSVNRYVVARGEVINNHIFVMAACFTPEI